MSEKTGNIVFSKNYNNYCRETLCEFLDNSRKCRDLSGNFDTMFFTNPWKCINFSKTFCKNIMEFLENFRQSWSRLKLFTNGVSLDCTRIYKSLVFFTQPLQAQAV